MSLFSSSGCYPRSLLLQFREYHVAMQKVPALSPLTLGGGGDGRALSGQMKWHTFPFLGTRADSNQQERRVSGHIKSLLLGSVSASPAVSPQGSPSKPARQPGIAPAGRWLKPGQLYIQKTHRLGTGSGEVEKTVFCSLKISTEQNAGKTEMPLLGT